jgi:hypothetical protein
VWNIAVANCPCYAGLGELFPRAWCGHPR